mmetsp:Transcript_126208/g.188326  ORF Transcript_126208/g.188326 Transcript_126208/m.188326 type:complete len:106 (+) Transcript_126208:1230-1547(+)
MPRPSVRFRSCPAMLGHVTETPCSEQSDPNVPPSPTHIASIEDDTACVGETPSSACTLLCSSASDACWTGVEGTISFSDIVWEGTSNGQEEDATGRKTRCRQCLS